MQHTENTNTISNDVCCKQAESRNTQADQTPAFIPKAKMKKNRERQRKTRREASDGYRCCYYYIRVIRRMNVVE